MSGYVGIRPSNHVVPPTVVVMDLENAIRVILADDHPVVRFGIRQFLEAEPGIEVMAEAADGQQALELTKKHRPDVLVLDVQMPQLSGIEVLRELVRIQSSTKAVLLTGTVDRTAVLQAMQLGARGVLLKESPPDDIRQAIRAVHAGHLWFSEAAVVGVVGVLQDAVAPTRDAQAPFGLTRREREIISAVVDGCTNKDVAAKLTISEDTVKRHITNIFNKLGMSTRVELAMFAVNHQLVLLSRDRK